MNKSFGDICKSKRYLYIEISKRQKGLYFWTGKTYVGTINGFMLGLKYLIIQYHERI